VKFTTLEGREVGLEVLASRYPMRTAGTSRSQSQFRLGELIRLVYGTNAMILEEFPVIGTRMSLDFYLPHHNIAFEFQGRQHTEYVHHFHRDQKTFDRQKARDKEKRRWCVLNEIDLVEVHDKNISTNDLKTLILTERDE
jgi:hypothetical protein